MADRQSATVVHHRTHPLTMVVDIGTSNLEPEAVRLLIILEKNSPHEAVPDKRPLEIVGRHPIPNGILL